MKSKYNAKKVVVDGIKFDSKKESARYNELKLLERCGDIRNLELQPRFELLPAFSYGDEKFRKMEYVADFRYTRDGKTFVEDVKGYKTKEYMLKKKLFLYKYGSDVMFVEV